MRSLTCAAVRARPASIGKVGAEQVHHPLRERLCEEHTTSFECARCVCPEPVLINHRLFSQYRRQKRVFLSLHFHLGGWCVAGQCQGHVKTDGILEERLDRQPATLSSLYQRNAIIIIIIMIIIIMIIINDKWR
jgi:hypothetical protein